MNELSFTEIYPKIYVYKNLFKNTQDIIDILNDVDENSFLGQWEDWYTFGKEIDTININSQETEKTKKELLMWKEVEEIFYKTTNHYAEVHGVKIDTIDEKWRKMGPSFCKYEPGSGVTDDLAMHYHTDYQIERKEERGYKFAITCTMYLNDNYKGGGIDFYINKKLFYYKPKAGDVIVFPAGDPNIISDKDELYHHGVKKCFDFPKYFIRNNWTYFYPGSDEWIKNESFYGEEIWKKMEDDRIKEGKSKGLYQFINEKEIREAVRIQ